MIALRFAVYVGAAVVIRYALWVLLPRLLPPRCPKCRAVLVTEVSCVYEGEERHDIILPKVNLVQLAANGPGHCSRRARMGSEVHRTEKDSTKPSSRSHTGLSERVE